MKRNPPPSIDPKSILSSLPETSTSWIRYRCRLVTPMYGGGVVAGEVDKDMPIRATAIRGHLRFWWRLLHKQLPSKELFEQERAIWGGLGNANELEASKVRIRVQGIDINHLINLKSYPNVSLGQSVSKKDLVPHNLTFVLMVSISPFLKPEQKASVLEAIRWWGTFGGIGARTRRGLGAVWIESVEGADPFRVVSQDEVKNQGLRLVFANHTPSDSLEAWKTAIDRMQQFRQGVGIGRNPGETPKKPGRSRWPEPNAIRKITGQHRIKQNGVSFEPPRDQKVYFPRAVFGLPIIFHFQNQKSDRQKDPDTCTLVVKSKTEGRMASPVILRPYPLDKDHWLPAVLVLTYEELLKRPLVLKQDKENSNQEKKELKVLEPGSWLPTLNEQNGESPVVPPMAGYNDPIEAFLNFFKKDQKSTKDKQTSHRSASAPQKSGDLQNNAEIRKSKAWVKLEKNGAISAKLQNGQAFYAVGPQAQAIQESLPNDIKAKLQKGFSATITVKNRELIRVEETS